MVCLRDLGSLSRLGQEAIKSISGYYCSCRMSEAMIETIIGAVRARKIQKDVFGVVTRVKDYKVLRRRGGGGIEVIT